MTKSQEAQGCSRQIHYLEMEIAQLQSRRSRLKHEMGHPDDEQIERAVEMGKDIRRGCTCDP